MFCNVIMVLLLHVHVCVYGKLARTGWKFRPPPKTVILEIKNINQSIKPPGWPSGKDVRQRAADQGLNRALPVGHFPGRVIPVT